MAPKSAKGTKARSRVGSAWDGANQCRHTIVSNCMTRMYEVGRTIDRNVKAWEV